MTDRHNDLDTCAGSTWFDKFGSARASLVGGCPPSFMGEANLNVWEKTQFVKCAKKIDQVVDVLIELFTLFGFRLYEHGAVYQHTKTVRHWYGLLYLMPPTRLAWLKLAKYKISAFFSAWKGEPLPVCPFSTTDNPRVLLGGRAYRWVRKISNFQIGTSKSLRFDAFLQSVLLSKKGMPRPDKSDLAQSAYDTIVKLSVPAPVPAGSCLLSFDELNDVGQSLKTVQYHLSEDTLDKQLRRTVDEIFGKKMKDGNVVYRQYTNADRMNLGLPSTSANYNRSRKHGGGLGELLSTTEDDESKLEYAFLSAYRRPGGYLPGHLSQPSKARDALRITDTGKWIWAVNRLEEEFLGTGPLFEQIQYDPSPEERVPVDSSDQESIGKVDDQFVYDSGRLKETALRFYFDLLNQAEKGSDFCADPVALPEALKIRVITRGPPLAQFAMKPLQKFLWRTFKESPCGRLVSEPESYEFLHDRLAAGISLMGKDPSFRVLSADYEAATDNLRSIVSNVIAEQISLRCGLLKSESKLFIRLLTRHNLEAVNPDTEELEQFQQQNGQLMGSIVSFIVLCIANTAILRWAEEVAHKRRISLKASSTIVNGDDGLAVLNDRGYRAWVKLANYIGMKPSQGKVYYSRSYFNINSRGYSLDHEAGYRSSRGNIRAAPFKEIPHINMGLLYGLKRSGGRVDPLGIDGLGAVCSALLKDTPHDLRSTVRGKFIQHNRAQLDSTRLPWFIPQWAGGLGLPHIDEDEALLDRKMLRGMMLSWSSFKTQTFRADQTWLTHKEVLKRYPQHARFVHAESYQAEEHSKFYGMLSLNLLFDSNVGIKDLIGEGAVSQKLVIRHNERVWQRAKAVVMGQPARWEVIDRIVPDQVISVREVTGLTW